MRIVSWNIRAGGGRRVAGIAAQIARWAPDVVALSEFRATPPSAALGAALTGQGLGHQLSTASTRLPHVNSLLIASRWPLTRVRLTFAPGADSGRWLLARVGSPTAITLGAMHVPNRVTGRKSPFLDAVLGMAHSWRRGPALLVGDTNSGLIDLDEEVPAFNVEEDGWIRGLEAAGWADGFRLLSGTERAYTWYSPNGGNGFRIDQAFVNRALRPRLRSARHEWGAAPGRRTGRSHRHALSDHAALLIDLAAASTAPAGSLVPSPPAGRGGR
jgi:exonuclease III